VQADEALASIHEALSVQYSVKQGTIAYGQGVKTATSSTIEESHKMAYAYRRAELRDRLRSHFNYLWCHADHWKQDPAGVPTVRNWFSSAIELRARFYILWVS
jgi:hypothetical protein